MLRTLRRLDPERHARLPVRRPAQHRLDLLGAAPVIGSSAPNRDEEEQGPEDGAEPLHRSAPSFSAVAAAVPLGVSETTSPIRVP